MNQPQSTAREALQDALTVMIYRTSILTKRSIEEVVYMDSEVLHAVIHEERTPVNLRLLFASRYITCLFDFGFELNPIPDALPPGETEEENLQLWDIAAQILRDRSVDWLKEDGVPGIMALRLKLDWDFLLGLNWDASSFEEIIKAKNGYSLTSAITMDRMSTDEDNSEEIASKFKEILGNAGEFDFSGLEALLGEDSPTLNEYDEDEDDDWDDDWEDDWDEDEDEDPFFNWLDSDGWFFIPNERDPLEYFVAADSLDTAKMVRLHEMQSLLNCQRSWAGVLEILTLRLRLHATDEKLYPTALHDQERFLTMGTAYSLIARLDGLLRICRTESEYIAKLEQGLKFEASRKSMEYPEYLDTVFAQRVELFKDEFDVLMADTDLSYAEAVDLTKSFIDWELNENDEL